MEFKSGRAKAPSYERIDEKRNKLKTSPKEGNLKKKFKSILQKAFPTLALRIDYGKENNDGDLVI